MKILYKHKGKGYSEQEYLSFTHKECAVCENILPVGEFYKKSAKTKRGWFYDGCCKNCSRQQCREYSVGNREKRNKRLREWRRKNPAKARQNDKKKALKQNYGITLEQLELLKSTNEYRCWICNRENERLFVDHCHQTKEVRGILCPVCNTYLGVINDDPEIASEIVKYLNGNSHHADVLLELANQPPQPATEGAETNAL